MFRSRRADRAAAGPADPRGGGAVADNRAIARAVVGVTGDKKIPLWKVATTPRTRRRVFALQAVAASESVGTVALILVLPVEAAVRGWSPFTLAVMFVLALLAYGFAALHGVGRFAPSQRVRVVQLMALNGAVLTVLCGLLPAAPLTAVLLIARSAVYGLQVSSMRPLIYDAVVPEVRVRAFMRVVIGGLFGAGIGAVIASQSVTGTRIVAGVVSGTEPAGGRALLIAGVVAVLLALFSLRITEPGLGGVEPARMDRAFGDTPRVEALRTPMMQLVGRVLQVHTVRTSLSSYVAVGALSYALIHAWVIVMQTTPSKPEKNGPSNPLATSSIFLILASVLFSIALSAFTAGQGMEKNRRKSMHSFMRTAWLDPTTIGGLCAVQLAFISFASAGAGPIPAVLGVGLMAGILAKVALDVSTMAVVTPNDRPIVAGLTTFSLVGGAILAGLLLPWNADATSTTSFVVRSGFAVLFIWLVATAFAGKRLMQQPDADLDAVLPLPTEAIIAETPVEPVTGFTTDVSPYAYVAPPAAVLDAAGLPPLLSVEKVNFAYGSVPVLFDVDLRVGAGELVALLGPNGVGKTTLLRNISGLEIPQQGVVRFNGNDVTNTASSRRVAMGLSQIVGGNAVFGSLTVAENLQMYGFSNSSDRKAVQAGIERAYQVFPRLADRRNQLGSTLSGGEQQMLGLSKALILKPRLLVVDEFSLGLAPVIVAELLSMVRQLNAEGTAVLLVEQSVNVALNLVDRCYFMEKGRVVYEGHAAELQARPDLVQALSLGGLPHELEESHA